MITYRLRSDRLREVAAARGDTTGYAICKRVGMAESTLSRLNRGLSCPSMGSLLKLAQTYGVPFAELVEQADLTDVLRASGEDNGDGAGGATPTPLAEKHDSTV